VGVEKVTVISTPSGSRSLVEGKNPFHVLLDDHSRRRAHHDGQHSRSEALFYYFRLEDQVPETQLLRGRRTDSVGFFLVFTLA
jgi:hypothetical protein